MSIFKDHFEIKRTCCQESAEDLAGNYPRSISQLETGAIFSNWEKVYDGVCKNDDACLQWPTRGESIYPHLICEDPVCIAACRRITGGMIAMMSWEMQKDNERHRKTMRKAMSHLLISGCAHCYFFSETAPDCSQGRRMPKPSARIPGMPQSHSWAVGIRLHYQSCLSDQHLIFHSLLSGFSFSATWQAKSSTSVQSHPNSVWATSLRKSS